MPLPASYIFGSDAVSDEPVQPQPQQQQQGPEQALASAGANTNSYLGSTRERAAQANALNNINIETNSKDGKVKIETDMDTAAILGQNLKAFQSIQNNYDRMLAQNQARQAALQQRPWANALATIAGSLAANDPNPITRGLGQAAVQLNPTLPQLQAQQMQLLKGQGDALGHTTGIASSLLASQRERNRTAATNDKTEATSHDAQLRLAQKAAKEGTLTEDQQAAYNRLSVEEFGALIKQAKESGAVKEQDFQKGIQKLRDYEDIKTAGAKDRQGYQHGLRQAEIAQRLGGLFGRLDKQHEYRVAEMEYADSLKTDAEAKKIGPQNMKRLVELRGVDKYTSGLRQLLASPEMAGYVGPLQAERILPRFAQSPDRAKVQEFFAQELPRVNSVIKGGVRMVSSPEGRKYIQDNLGFQANLPAESILKILDNVDSILTAERESVVESVPNGKWVKYPELLGSTYDYAKSISSGARDVAPQGLKGVSAPGPKAHGPIAPAAQPKRIQLGIDANGNVIEVK